MIEAICSAPPALFEFFLRVSSANPDCASFLNTPIVPTDTTFVTYLTYFGMTCLLETPPYFLCGLWAKQKVPRVLLQIVVLNLATHPIVFWVAPWILAKLHQTTGLYLLLGELFAFGVEALLLRKWAHYSWKFALATSTLANLTSWWVGVLLIEKGILA